MNSPRLETKKGKPIPLSALTTKATIRQTQMHAHSGGINSTETGIIETNRNFIKVRVNQFAQL